jgi:chemosensory pili system protein ChpA (sensor histidine kinase/response regulator)
MAAYLSLIVEDDVELADIFNIILTNAGLKTEVVRDGQLALERLAELVPDIVLLDVNLPHVSGLEILTHIKADPRLTHTKVVIVTANPHAVSQVEDEADLVLIKPVSFKQTLDLFGRMVQSMATVG